MDGYLSCKKFLRKFSRINKNMMEESKMVYQILEFIDRSNIETNSSFLNYFTVTFY